MEITNQDLLDLKQELLQAISQVSAKVDAVNSQLHGDGINSGIGSRLHKVEQDVKKLEKLNKLEMQISDLQRFREGQEEFSRKLFLKLIGAVAGSSAVTAAGFHFLG